jgi:Rix1 complex component involved in 60S ribosome maturation
LYALCPIPVAAMVKSKGFLQKGTKSRSTADFKHLKGKVGKRAVKPHSHTDTSFKSRKVSVAAQSILTERVDGEASSARGQTLSSLQAQLRHYASATRKDALVGLRSLLSRNPGIAEHRFAALTEGSLECIVCEDHTVRTALLEYQTDLLASTTAATLAPFSDLYTAYTVSALTSLDKGVRRDGLSLLALLLARFPQVMAARAAKLLPNYATLLDSDPSSKKQAIRLSAATSLLALMRATATAGADAAAANELSSSASDTVWRPESTHNAVLITRSAAADCSALQEPGERSAAAASGSSTGATTAASALNAVLRAVLDKLYEMWVEALGSSGGAAAAAASGGTAASTAPPDAAQLQLIADLLITLLRHPLLSNSSSSSSSNSGTDAAVEGSSVLSVWLARHFLPLAMGAFPVTASEGDMQGAGAADVSRALTAVNASLCELVVGAAAAAATVTTTASTAAASADDAASAVPDHHVAAALSYVQYLLQSGVSATGSGGVGRVLTVLRAALGQGASAAVAESRASLLAAFGGFYTQLHAESEAKALCARFVCELVRARLADGQLVSAPETAASGKHA